MQAEKILVYPASRPETHLVKDLNDGSLTMYVTPQAHFHVMLVGEEGKMALTVDRDGLEDLAREMLKMLQAS